MAADPSDLTTLANARSFLRLGKTDDDALLQLTITGFSQWLVREVDRQIKSGPVIEVLDGNDIRIRQKPAVNLWSISPTLGLRGYALVLREDPVTAVEYVKVDGVEIPQRPADFSSDGWVLTDNQRLALSGNYEFTPGVANVEIKYTAGYLTVPADLELATLEAVAWFYRSRDTLRQASKSAGGESITWRSDVLPPFASSVLDKYRRVKVS